MCLDLDEGDTTREDNIITSPHVLCSNGKAHIMPAPVCPSWPEAHGTNVIRSFAHPWCLPEALRRKPFSGNDALALQLGSATMASLFRVAKAVHRYKVQWILENTFTSICWQTPQARELMAMENGQLVVVNFCACGAALRNTHWAPHWQL